MPDHADDNPSCTVIASEGFFECRSRCGTILAFDLIVACGQAGDRAGAARWIEEKFNLSPTPAASLPRIIEPVEDPSLSVETMLGMLGLPSSVADKFGLEDVQTWANGTDSDPPEKYALYSKGFYGSVLIPYSLDPAPASHPLAGRSLCTSARARVRSLQPKAKLKWSNRVKRYDFTSSPPRMIHKVDQSIGEPPTGAYGLPWFEPMGIAGQFDLRGTILIVEGESDVWSAHTCGFTAVMGVPGAPNGRIAAPGIVEALLIATEGNAAAGRVVIWQEPDAAGAKFPTHVRTEVLKHLHEMGIPAPTFVTIDASKLERSPKDPRALLQMHGPDGALENLCALAAGAGESGSTGAVEPDPRDMPADPFKKKPRSGAEEWECAAAADCPDLEHLVGTSIVAADRTFTRTEHGWSVETKVKNEDGGFDTKLKTVCSPFVITRVDVCDDEEHATIASPRSIGGAAAWRERRVKLSTFSSSEKGSSTLISMGIQPWHRQKSAMLDLALVLANRVADIDGIVKIPSGTGWTGDAGASTFAGIDAESSGELPQIMFEGNEARRAKQPDEHAAAAEWWEKVAAPLVSLVDDALPRHAAPLIALGAAAAAPMLGNLTILGIDISPVAWVSGLGGGGKTVTLSACASIYAPEGSQGSFRTGADMSRAALNARAASTRDLPFLLDDVTQVPAKSDSTLRGEAARVEGAALLAMAIFDRTPTERANRDGTVRLIKPYRSTAMFTAEAPLTRAVAPTVTAGNLRRVSNLRGEPMNDRGLPQPYSEVVKAQSRKNGGAAGSLLVQNIRTIVAAGSFPDRVKACRRAINNINPNSDKEQTQRESMIISAFGFAMLAESCGAMTFDEALEHAAATIAPFLLASSADGGAVSSEDMGGAADAIESVRSFVAAHDVRFRPQNSTPESDAILAEVYGKFIKPLPDGSRRVVFLDNAMKRLCSSFGVSNAQIQTLLDAGLACHGHRIRLGTASPRGIMFVIGRDEQTDDSYPDDYSPPGDTHRYANPPEEDTSGYSFPPDIHDSVDIHSGSEHPCPTDFTDESQADDEEMEEVATFRWSDGMYQLDPGEAEARAQIANEARFELVALREAFEADGIEVADPPPLDDPRWAKVGELGDRAPARLWGKCVEVGKQIQNPDIDADLLLDLKREHVRIYRILLMLRMYAPEWFMIGAPDD